MNPSNSLQTNPVHSASIWQRMLQGAAIALILIVIFLAGVDDPDPAWGKFWMVQPLIIVPCAGAMGGVIYYFLDHMRRQGGWITVLATLLSLIGFLFCLWMGSVLGLNGTLWN